MKKDWGTLIFTGITLALASVPPLIFPVAQSGFSNLSTLALYGLIPAIILLAILAILAHKSHPVITRSIAWGALAGAIATVALEIVRSTGFHLGYMPGSLPKLMGVLLLNQFMTGPTTLSNIAGWAYHFSNGAAFGIIYVLFVGTRRRWAALIFALIIGTIFLLSPVVRTMGVGFFGLEFSIGLPIVIYLAHLAFGGALGWLSRRFVGDQPSMFLWCIRFLLGKSGHEQQPTAIRP